MVIGFNATLYVVLVINGLTLGWMYLYGHIHCKNSIVKYAFAKHGPNLGTSADSGGDGPG